MFGSPETTPGGRALRFYASVRLDIRRIETLKEGVEAIGNRVRVKVVKNKVAPPFKQAEFDIIYGDGISWEGTVLETGLERKVVQKSGSYFSFGDERLGQGRQNATAFLKEHPDVVQAILQAIQAQAPAGQVDLGAAAARRPRPSRRRRAGCARKKRPRSARLDGCAAERDPIERRGARAAPSRPLAPRDRRAAREARVSATTRGRRARDARARRLRRRRALRPDARASARRPRVRRRGDPRRPRAAGRRRRGGEAALAALDARGGAAARARRAARAAREDGGTARAQGIRGGCARVGARRDRGGRATADVTDCRSSLYPFTFACTMHIPLITSNSLKPVTVATDLRSSIRGAAGHDDRRRTELRRPARGGRAVERRSAN